jgi:hypothetical protein
MAALHNNGIGHRDFRPDNLVFFTFKPEVKWPRLVHQIGLIDYAFACELNVPGMYNGATHFVSPAVRQHMQALRDARASFCFQASDDLYSWLYVCLWMSNRAYFAGEMKRIEEEFAGPHNLVARQDLIAAVFDANLSEYPWRDLRDAVRARADAPQSRGHIDYSDLFDLIPLTRQAGVDC